MARVLFLGHDVHVYRKTPRCALFVQNDAASNSDPFVLVLENVTVQDDGWYTCLVGNAVGFSHESFWLTVKPVTTRTHCTYRYYSTVVIVSTTSMEIWLAYW